MLFLFLPFLFFLPALQPHLENLRHISECPFLDLIQHFTSAPTYLYQARGCCFHFYIAVFPKKTCLMQPKEEKSKLCQKSNLSWNQKFAWRRLEHNGGNEWDNSIGIHITDEASLTWSRDYLDNHHLVSKKFCCHHAVFLFSVEG